jgi:hypothetical protein
LATNHQANSVKDRIQGKLVPLVVLALKDDFLGGETRTILNVPKGQENVAIVK